MCLGPLHNLHRESRILSTVLTDFDILSNCDSDIGFHSKKLGRWVLWYFDDVRAVFSEETDEPPNSDDIYVFQHVLCHYVHGRVSHSSPKRSRFQVLQRIRYVPVYYLCDQFRLLSILFNSIVLSIS